MMHRPPRIAIVGAGPTGLTLAILLRQAHLDPVVFEKREVLASLPAAHVVNVRTCEIFAELGIYDAVAAVAAPLEKMQAITWRESVAGRIHGHLPLYGDEHSRQRRQAASPVRALNIGQDDVERIMLARLNELGGDVRLGQDVSNVVIRDGKPLLSVGDVEHEFDFVIACDGVRSTVRRTLGIQMEGPSSIAEFIAVYFKADLSRHMDGLSGPVHFLAGPDVRGSIIGFDLATTWALMCVVPSSEAALARRDVLGPELVRRAIDDAEIDFEVLSVGTWNMSAQVAEHFQDGPVFLAGDAAHRFPPTGGLGLNTGVPDAHNIAWKLVAIAQGWAGPELLDSYEAERRPLAIHNCNHSVSNMKRMVLVDQALGAEVLTPIDLDCVDRPPSPRLDLGLDQASPEAVAKQARINTAIEAEREHFDSLRVELFYSYPNAEESSLHPERPTVGSRVPHAFVRDGTTSTLDLAHGTFVLFAGSSQKSWIYSMVEAARERGVPMRIVELAELGAAADDWCRDLGIGGEGVVLVRPDGHIAWIYSGSDEIQSAPPPEEILRNVLGSA